MEKGRKDIKEPTHVLTTKFDILKKSERPVTQLEHLIFTMIRHSIFLNGFHLYIFHKLDRVGMF
jgi:hypothetical protein